MFFYIVQPFRGTIYPLRYFQTDTTFKETWWVACFLKGIILKDWQRAFYSSVILTSNPSLVVFLLCYKNHQKNITLWPNLKAYEILKWNCSINCAIISSLKNLYYNYASNAVLRNLLQQRHWVYQWYLLLQLFKSATALNSIVKKLQKTLSTKIYLYPQP